MVLLFGEDPKLRQKFKAGDVIGFSACSYLGVGINVMTWGVPFIGLSHVAVLAEAPGYSKPLLFESSSLLQEPCLIRGVATSGVQAHRPVPRLVAYRGKVWHYPLAETLTVEDSQVLTKFCLNNLGKGYDAIGAFRSREAGFGWLERRLRREDLVSLFCSEFCAAALRSCGQFRTLTASKWNPNALGRELVRRGICSRPRRLK